MGNVDTTIRQPLGVITIPTSQTTVASSQVTLTAGSRAIFTTFYSPAGAQLSLWNHFFSLVIDDITVGVWPNNPVTNDSTPYSNYLNLYSNGPNLTSGQLNVFIETWSDWAQSNDSTNFRCFKVRIHNTDSSPHTFYYFYKGYLNPTRAGVS